MNSADNQYTDVREQLYQLGFEQPMPLGSLALVSTLLGDLVKTTTNLKRFDEENQQLKKERVAWELAAEPYKCDNSRLLAECNRLHLDAIKEREAARLKLIASRRLLRQLETDKQCVSQQNAELCAQLSEMAAANGRSKSGGAAASATGPSRPQFVSTVRPRSAYTIAGGRPTVSSTGKAAGGGVRGVCCAACSCDCRRNGHHEGVRGGVGGGGSGGAEMQRLKNELLAQKEYVDELRIQLESRDREITRLTQLLNGGSRSTAGLAQDCCFRGVNKLSEDVATLQQQKLQLQAELQRAVADQHEAKERACSLEDKKRELERDVGELERVALHIEEQCNQRLLVKNNECVKLRSRVEELQRRTADNNSNKASAELANDAIQNRAEVRRCEGKIGTLQSDLRLVMERNEELSVLNEKLLIKIDKLKTRYRSLQEEQSISREKLLATQQDAATSPAARTKSTEMLQSERDFYQNEYLKLLNQPGPTRTAEDTAEIHRLQSELLVARQESGQSVRAQLQRLEREKSLLLADVERLRGERADLSERLKALSGRQAEQSADHELQHSELLATNHRLAAENEMFGANAAALQATAEMLRTRLGEVETMVRDRDAECEKLRTAYEQMKMIQDQTEKALAHRQSALSQRTGQLEVVESQLSARTSSREREVAVLGELRAQVSALQAQADAADRHRDELTNDLDAKTEKLYAAEAELLHLRSSCAERQAKLEHLQRQIDTANSENRHKEGTLRQTTGETEALRRQVAQVVGNHENAMAENRRLLDELADQTAEHEATRKRLGDCEREVERLKSQLSQYVHEVQKAEDLLMRKEIERDEMLDNFKTLSRDAVLLEDNNQSLEQQATSAQRSLRSAEAELDSLRDQLAARGMECERLDRQVTELSRQVALGSSEHEQCAAVQQRLRADLQATHELCERLDEEKAHVHRELDECSAIRNRLEHDNERLRGDLRVQQTGQRASEETVQQMLSTAREDLDTQRSLSVKQGAELRSMREKVEELQTKLADERTNAVRNETLVHEYSIQIKELRQRLTDKRFELDQRTKGGNIQPPAEPAYDRTASDQEQNRGQVSPNDQSTVSTETSQLNHIARCLSSVDRVARNAPQPTTGDQYSSPPFQVDSRPQLQSTPIQAEERKRSRRADGGEAIELVQMHDRFMLHERFSAEGMLSAEEFPDTSSMKTLLDSDRHSERATLDHSFTDSLESSTPMRRNASPLNLHAANGSSAASTNLQKSMIEHIFAKNMLMRESQESNLSLNDSLDSIVAHAQAPASSISTDLNVGSKTTLLPPRADLTSSKNWLQGERRKKITTWSNLRHAAQHSIDSRPRNIKPEPVNSISDLLNPVADLKPEILLSHTDVCNLAAAIVNTIKLEKSQLQPTPLVEIDRKPKLEPQSIVQQIPVTKPSTSDASVATYHSAVQELAAPPEVEHLVAINPAEGPGTMGVVSATIEPTIPLLAGAPLRLQPRTFDTSHLRPPPPFHRKRPMVGAVASVTVAAQGRSCSPRGGNEVHVQLTTQRRPASRGGGGQQETSLTAECQIRRT